MILFHVSETNFFILTHLYLYGEKNRKMMPDDVFLESKTFIEHWYCIVRRWKPLEFIPIRGMRWDQMLQTAEVTQQLISTIIEIIGRKTSEEYAAVTIRNLLRQLQPRYPFLREIEIKNNRTVEVENVLSVNVALNEFSPKDVGQAMKELIVTITNLLGKNAGYFFIRETSEKIGIEYDMFLLKTMNINLTLMQSTIIVEKKSENLIDIQKADVIKRFLKNLSEAIEKQTSKSFAITCLQQHLGKLRQQYPFLDYIRINDIRQTGGDEEIIIQQEINTIGLEHLGKAITAILQETERTCIDQIHTSITGDLKTRLSIEYLTKFREMGVTILSHGNDYNAIFTEVLKTIIEIIGETKSETETIQIVNLLLRNLADKYAFIKEITIESLSNERGNYRIKTGNTINTISQTDARRALQQLLETTTEVLDEERSENFIQQFKDFLDIKCLIKIEEIGVNFHLIELHQHMNR